MGSDWVGNPELAPSRNWGADLAASLRRPRFTLSASLFANRVIDYVTVHERTRQEAVPGVMNAKARSYANVDATLLGAEAGASATLHERLLLSADLSWVRGSQRADPSRGILSTHLPETPPLRARASLRYDTGVVWGEAEGVFSAAQTRVAEELLETPTAGWGIANLRAGAVWRGLTVTVGVLNVFDRLYEESLSYQRDPFRSGVKLPEPGRSVFANIGWRH